MSSMKQRSINLKQLIKLVGKRPELYNPRSKEYGDLHKRECSWQQIAKELNVEVESCKNKWNILRSGYRRVMRNKEISKSFTGRKWRFEDDMSFLRDCVKRRRRRPIQPDDITENTNFYNEDQFMTIIKEEPSVVVYESDNVIDENDASSCASMEQATTAYQNDPQLITAEEKEDILHEVNGIRHFFLSLAETVKTLPSIVQAQVKAEVFRAVNVAELNYLQGKGQCKCHLKKTADHSYTS